MGGPTQGGLLEGIGVLVTRAREQAGGMVRRLEGMGASAHVVPAITVEPLPDPEGLKGALAVAAEYDAFIFSSVNGVTFFLEHLKEAGLDPSGLPGAVCVGPRTANAWRSAGGRVISVPERFTGTAIPDALGENLSRKRYLVVRPEVVKTELGRLLEERGARVDQVVIYRTVSGRDDSDLLRRLLDRKAVDVVTFASPSAVAGVMGMLDGPGDIENLICLCIGPTTAAAAKKAGLTRVYLPDEYTIEGMLRMLPTVLGKAAERR